MSVLRKELARTTMMKFSGPLSDVAIIGPKTVFVSHTEGKSNQNATVEPLPTVPKSSPVRIRVQTAPKMTHCHNSRMFQSSVLSKRAATEVQFTFPPMQWTVKSWLVALPETDLPLALSQFDKALSLV